MLTRCFSLLTIDGRALWVAGEGSVLRWSRCSLRQAWRSRRHVRWQSLWLRRLLGRWRSKSRTTGRCAAGHDASEKIRRALADGWGRIMGTTTDLRRASMWWLSWSATSFEFSVQACDVFLIPESDWLDGRRLKKKKLANDGKTYFALMASCCCSN